MAVGTVLSSASEAYTARLTRSSSRRKAVLTTAAVKPRDRPTTPTALRHGLSIRASCSGPSPVSSGGVYRTPTSFGKSASSEAERLC